MKTTSPIYTSALPRAIKTADVIYCHVPTDGGRLQITTGTMILTMTRDEYNDYVLPIVKAEPGEWRWTAAGGTGADDSGRFSDIFSANIEKASKADLLIRCPISFPIEKNKKQATMAPLYCRKTGAATFVNAAFLAGFSPDVLYRGTGSLSPVVAYYGDEPVAMILPIKANPEQDRAVHAFFTAPAADDQDEAAALRAQLQDQAAEMIRLRDRASQLETRYSHLQDNAAAQVDELTAKVDELTARRDALQAQLDQAAAVPQQAAPEEKPQPKDAAQLIASRWSQVDGLTATVKGAQTASPVVWLEGDTAAHVAAIEAEGGKWSAKRSAYYFRVA